MNFSTFSSFVPSTPPGFNSFNEFFVDLVIFGDGVKVWKLAKGSGIDFPVGEIILFT